MFKVLVDYPTRDEEFTILERIAFMPIPEVRKVITIAQLAKMRNVVKTIYVDEKVKNYILDIVFATRKPEDAGLPDLEKLIEFGASPRASIYLAMAARAHCVPQRPWLCDTGRHQGFRA